jgi:peptidoglycan/xylan/chitin deacetylase (PgdA/CDA1 family)
VTPDSFERQIAYLLAHGWRATTFTAAALAPPSERTLAITFDDAFASVKRYALPILSGLGAPATVFAPTAFMDGAPSLKWDGIDHWLGTAAEPELAPLSWNELGELAELGWEIGSHTCNHPHLPRLDDAALEQELHASRERCAERLGRSCTSIAYPYGDVDARVAGATARVGYSAGAALSGSLRQLGAMRQPRLGIYHVDEWPRFRLKVLKATRFARSTRLWPAGTA